MGRIEAIIFDMDGTITDSETVWTSIDDRFLEQNGKVQDVKETRPLVMGKSSVEAAEALKRQYDLKGDVNDLAKSRINIAKEMFSIKVKFIPGFLEFYDAIRNSYKTAIATSTQRDMLDKIAEKMHLFELFRGHIYSIEDIGFISKPSPDIFLYAAKKLDAKPQNCVVIEDSPLGVEGAKRAGMRCIALTTTTQRDMLGRADVIFDSYSQMSLKTIEALAD